MPVSASVGLLLVTLTVMRLAVPIVIGDVAKLLVTVGVHSEPLDMPTMSSASITSVEPVAPAVAP